MALGMLGLAAFATASGGTPKTSAKQNGAGLMRSQAQQTLDDAANRFIANAGQWDAKALYLARAKNMNVWLTRDGMTLDYFREGLDHGKVERNGQVIHMAYAGGSSAQAIGVNRHRMITDYVGSDKVRHTA